MTKLSQLRDFPTKPSLEHLRKEAKQQLAVLRARAASAQLADAQLVIARSYGFPSWRALKLEVDRRRDVTSILPALVMADALPGCRRAPRRARVPNADDMASACFSLCALPMMVLQATGPMATFAAFLAVHLH